MGCDPPWWVTGIALGYEDLTDHDSLRHDPLLKLMAAPKARGADRPAPLAGSSTLGRMERSFEDSDRRTHKITAQPNRLQDLYVDLFTESHDTAPERITLDLDATDIETHGHQVGGFFNGYYEHRCFLPLYVTCGPHLLLAKLRHGNVDGAKGAKAAVKRIVGRIRKAWPTVKILVRGDSGFAREALMAWCEANKVDYLFGLARNTRLVTHIQADLRRAEEKARETGQAARCFADFLWTTRKSWSRHRRVVSKAEWTPFFAGGKANPRFVVTSLSRQEHQARSLYEDVYCQRGDMENRIKECQADLFADRSSAATMRANQLRLWFASMAYVLLDALRRIGLQNTRFARATCGTIRLKLLKIGALVKTSVRRVKVAMASGHPYHNQFAIAHTRLSAAAV